MHWPRVSALRRYHPELHAAAIGNPCRRLPILKLVRRGADNLVRHIALREKSDLMKAVFIAHKE
jgi:hypothetical protein